MPDNQWGFVPLRQLFRINGLPVIPADRPKCLFHYHSIPSFDENGGCVVEFGSEIESNKTKIDKPCVLVSKLNPRKPRVSLAEPKEGEEHCCSTEFICYEPKNEDEVLEFWRAYFLSAGFAKRLEQIAVGSTNSHTRAAPRETLDWLVPNPSESQKRVIATILDILDTQIRQTEAIIAKLQQVKQGLLHDLLTRGIDENGQLRPPYEQAPELYKDSPLGWIPKEWKATELGNALSHIDAGRSPNCPDIPAPSGAWGVLKVSAVHPDGFKEQETKIVEQSVFHNSQLEVKDGDLLITRANTPELVGLPCLVSTERDRLMLSDKTLRLNFKEGQNKAFFFYVLTQSWVRSQIQVAATGTSMSMKNISQLSLKNLKVKQPPTTEQAKISQRVYEAGRQIREETLLLEKIKKQKAGLMDDLLTGRVRVTELIDQAQRAS